MDYIQALYTAQNYHYCLCLGHMLVSHIQYIQALGYIQALFRKFVEILFYINAEISAKCFQLTIL